MGTGSESHRSSHERLFADTRPEAEEVLLNLLRQAPPWRKLQLVGDMYETVRHLLLVGIRSRHPDASEQECRRRLADLLLGPELAERVYGPLESPIRTCQMNVGDLGYVAERLALSNLVKEGFSDTEQ